MSQSCFSLGFLTQNSLYKLSTIHGYKGYLFWCVFGMQKVRFVTNRVVWWLGLTTWLSRKSESRANCLAKLEVLSCNTPAGVTLQLPCMLHTCLLWQFAGREIQSRVFAKCALLNFSSHFLTHYPYMILI